MPREALQRFVALDVGEVSLVDSPANEREFAVVKSLNPEDSDMADTAEVIKGDNNVETVSLEVAKATNDAVEKAMEKVTGLVENIAKLAQPEPEAEASNTDVAKGTDELPSEADIEKGLTKEQKETRQQMRQKLEKQMAGCGMKGDMLKSAVDVAMRTLAGQGAFTPGQSAKPPVKKTAKSDGEGENTDTQVSKSELNPQDIVQETIKQISQGLQGAQTLGAPDAQKALKAAVETLQSLLKQVSMQEVPTGGMPKNTLPSNNSYGASGIKEITKALEGVNDALGELKETQKSLSERLEDIEKTRQPDTSGGADQSNTTDTKKSMWSGIL